MRSLFIRTVAGSVVVLALSGCRTSNRVPDYLPREVNANQVGNAVVYETNDPRNNLVQGSTTQAPTAAVSAVSPAVLAEGGLKRRTPYGQPEGVSISDKGLREATLIWALPHDEVYRYRIERSESPAGPFEKVEELSPQKLQYRDKGTSEAPLKDNTSYYYQITAVLDRDGRESIPSKLVKTLTAPPPLAPLNVKAVASGSRAVTVTWDASQSDGVTEYRVERALAAGPGPFERIAQVRSPKLVDGGTPASTLKDSTKYLYRVVTLNRVNSESPASEAGGVMTLPPPAVVQKVSAVSEEVRCVPVAWAQSPESDVVRYDVYRARAAEGPFDKIGAVQSRSTVSYLDGGANPGNLEDEALYFYRIRAVNAVTSESADSETVKAITRSVPAEVSNVSVISNRPREIPVSWAAHPDKTVLGYEVWRSEEGADEWIQLSRINGRDVTRYLDRGEIKPKTGLGQLKDATVYHYKLIAFNTAHIKSSASTPASARTKYRPVMPSGLTVTTNMPLAIKLDWAPNPEKDIGTYVVEYSDVPDGSFKKLVSVQASRENRLSAKDMALPSGEVRYYRVKVIDQDGLESDWSGVARGVSKPVPDAPAALQAEPSGTTVNVTWKAPGQPDIRHYKVWRKKLFGWELVSSTEQTHYLFEFTELSKPMTISISAVDKDELESGRSESIEIKPGL